MLVSPASELAVEADVKSLSSGVYVMSHDVRIQNLPSIFQIDLSRYLEVVEGKEKISVSLNFFYSLTLNPHLNLCKSL
jgi:hypothetical protein